MKDPERDDNPDWDDALRDRPMSEDRKDQWDERDGSRMASIGALVWLVIALLSMIVLSAFPVEY